MVGGVSLSGCRYLPRMDRQANIQPYEQRMPAPPAQSVPMSGKDVVPSIEQAEGLSNPVARTDRALLRGRLYYGYYCAVCHGPDGRGHVPVGESYHPAPTDLSAPALQAKSDGALYRGMVVGMGHEPTLQYTVPPERRWLIVHHLRKLGTVTDFSPRGAPLAGRNR